jgi:methionine-R-sulfoxide reductase
MARSGSGTVQRLAEYYMECRRERIAGASSKESHMSISSRAARALMFTGAILAISGYTCADAQSAGNTKGERKVTDTFKKPSESELKQKLTPIQFEVTQHEATERPFQNEFWNNHEEGIYVDVVSGEPLFSSRDKFESGTGWPSFTRPLAPENIKTKTDRSLLMTRTEVRSAKADSHLGHLFDDGPKPTGLRYCMNSASRRFIPVSKLAAEGYGEYAKLFEKK